MEQKNQPQSEEIEIDLVELIGVLWSKLWIILVCGLNLALAVFLISVYLLTPAYESVTKIYIINRQSGDSLTYSDLQSGAQLTKDYKELVTSRPVLEEVKAELSLDMDNDDLAEKITVDVPTDTRIVTITVEDADPYMARSLADRIRISAAKHIENVMNTEAVNVVEEANLPTEQSSPKVLLNTAIGGAAGIFLAMAVIVLIYIMDDTIKNPEDVEHYLNISVLGSIPVEDDKKTVKKKHKKTRTAKATREQKNKPGAAEKPLGRGLGTVEMPNGK